MDVIDIALCKKRTAGFKVIRENDTHDGIYYETTTGASFDIKIPNFHIHNNLYLLERFSLDSTTGKLLFDGNEIPLGVLSEDEIADIWKEVESNK